MRPILSIMAVLLLLTACGPSNIPGTKVPDTQANREIVDLVETYRVAVEDRDMDTLGQIVSRRYFENASTTAKTTDDYGYEQLLKEVFPVLRDNVKKVVYKIDIERITVTGREASVYIEWDLKFQYVEGGLEGWATAKDKNRVDLVMEDGRWKILSGL